MSSGLGSGAGPAGAAPMRLIGRDGSGVPGGVAATLRGMAGRTQGGGSRLRVHRATSPAASPSGATGAARSPSGGVGVGERPGAAAPT